jgi:hypothetical protein
MDRRTSFPDSGFYDVSSWHFGYAMNVAFAEVKDEPRLKRSQHMFPEPEPLPPALAYAVDWGSEASFMAVGQLVRKGFRLGLMKKPMQVGETKLPAGQVVVFLQPGEEVPEELELLRIEGVLVTPIQTALTNIGTDGGDLGSPSLSFMTSPRIAILSGPTTSANSVGEAWHTLNHRWGLPVTLLDSERAATANLSQYSAIVVTDGANATLTPLLRTYVEGGGVLVATGSGASWAVTNNLLPLRARPDVSTQSLNNLPYDQIADARRSLTIPGTILQTEWDLTHPLAMGSERTVPVLRRGSAFFDSTGSPGVVVARYTDSPLLAGYLHPEQVGRAKGAVAVAAVRLGGGSVIGIMDNPNFRGFWLGTGPVFANAVLFGRAF